MKHIIIGQDHNLDLLKSNIHSTTQDFIDLNTDNDVWPIITKPTRITKNSTTLIDNIIVSEGIYNAYDCGILLEDISDHLPCILIAKNLRSSKKDPVVITSRKITPKTLAAIKNKLCEVNLESITLEGDIEESFDKFHSKVVK